MDLPTFISFMVMWMLLFFGILVIVLTYRYNRHLIDLIHKERMNALDHGLDVPAELNAAGGARGTLRTSNYLHRGLIFTLLGLSFMAALGVNAGGNSALWGLPVTAFGVAYLILYFIATHEENRS